MLALLKELDDVVALDLPRAYASRRRRRTQNKPTRPAPNSDTVAGSGTETGDSDPTKIELVPVWPGAQISGSVGPQFPICTATKMCWRTSLKSKSDGSRSTDGREIVNVYG